MRMKKHGLALLVLVVVISGLFIVLDKALACTCVKTDDPKEKLEKYDAVFTGKVLHVGDFYFTNRYDRYRTYRFEVDKAWKGVKHHTLAINAVDGHESSCGTSFLAYETYLVFASSKKEKLYTSHCSGNVNLAEGSSLVKGLGKDKLTGDLTYSASTAVNKVIYGAGGVLGLLWLLILYRMKD
ncbi:hypothetical protein [Paenibacillus sp. 1001270B_150601_E10]|uniref:hypothetical protein n=1 Tax=Paenibacillus sp. 1001270B_150601_E10 TaxID=2787079 RepID=UPI00189CB9D7|nr:hypothetical protein [Paenibacillus sp. 1001270B_150601_E10]